MEHIEEIVRVQRRISVRTAAQTLSIFWPKFVEANGCVFAEFQSGDVKELSEGKSATECFVNHTHIFDEFRNRATRETKESVSDDLDVVEEAYDFNHADFDYACEVGKTMARMWALKLKADFPLDRFRVYYTEYDNPIVRFHKVRSDEPVWIADEQLRDGSSFSGGAVIYDTDYIDKPVVKRDSRPN